MSAAIHPTVNTSFNPAVVCEGWLLKKRRKKLQGFARRYFILHHSGVLAYSFGPGQPTRDHIDLHHAAISTAIGRKDIHVDSNTATFHIKCLSTQDFETWMVAFRKFISSGIEAKRSASLRIAARQGSIHLTRTGNIMEEMATTIAELDEVFSLLLQTTPSYRDSSLNSKRAEKEKHKELFGLKFKKPSHSQESPEHSMDGLAPNHTILQNRTKVALELLKNQHSALSKLLPNSTALDGSQSRMSPLPTTAEEEDAHSSKRMSPKTPSSVASHAKPYRASLATSISESINEWYDAIDGMDGPHEYVMESEPPIPGEMSQQPSQITTDSISVVDQADDSSIDTDIEEFTEDTHGVVKTTYRTQLPVPCPEDEGSLFAVLKKNVGKDLSTITFPVTFNEPLTMLQRTAEELEYWDLLEQASRTDDPAIRMSYVAAFAVSGYAHTRHRSGRKGFNPLLGETFEDIRMKFIAEKVKHNPVEIAYHAEGKGWELTGFSSGKTKFWGKSLEIIPLGSTRVRIGQDIYVWKKPSSFMRNLMVGTKYFEHVGKMTIENTTTGMRCILDFKQNGYWGPTNVVSGVVQDADGQTISKLDGKWDEQMALELDDDRFHVLWRCSAFPKNTLQYYGFTSFGITLNELTSDIAGKLAPTDSRLRPDVRALENGQLDLAEEEKLRVESLQRERRQRGEEPKPKWFKPVGADWEYAGGYWEARSRSWKQETIRPLW